MKVLQVNKLYYPHIGGVENHVRMLANGLHSSKPDVEIEVLVANEQLKTTVELVDNVRVTRVASLGRLRSAPMTLGFVPQLIKAKKDIYHYHFPNPTGEIAFLTARPKGKLVVTYHSDIIRQKTILKFYKPLLDKFLDRADRVLVNSPNQLEGSSFLQRVKEKCEIVPFGIESDWLTPTSQTINRASEIRNRFEGRIAFFLGRLIYYKGVEYLIKAMENVDGTAIVAGAGPLERELRELAKARGVEKKIVFVGALTQAELAAYYHACDVFVLPSIEPSEAYGLVQLEAHACGKPVISTNLPTGVPFANRDGTSGLVVPPRDTDALAQAINKLFKDDELRSRLGNQAKDRFEREFTAAAMVERIYNVYNSVLESN